MNDDLPDFASGPELQSSTMHGALGEDGEGGREGQRRSSRVQRALLHRIYVPYTWGFGHCRRLVNWVSPATLAFAIAAHTPMFYYLSLGLGEAYRWSCAATDCAHGSSVVVCSQEDSQDIRIAAFDAYHELRVVLHVKRSTGTVTHRDDLGRQAQPSLPTNSYLPSVIAETRLI